MAATPPDLIPLITSQSALHRKRAADQWARKWNDPTAPRGVGGPVRRLEPTPNPHVLRKFGPLDKARSAVLIQMRTAHIGLNGFLAKIGVPDIESHCPCGHGPETRDHVLLHCGLYRELRETVLWANGKRETDINVLLGDPTRVAATTRFMMETGRLQQFRRYQMDKESGSGGGGRGSIGNVSRRTQ